MTSMPECYSFTTLITDPSSHLVTIVIFTIVYGVIFIVSLFGNIAVIVVTLRLRTLQSVQNIFILNLAASDIILSFLSVPLTPVAHIKKEWYFGSVMCRLVGGCQAIGMFIATFSLCAIAVDRYFRLVHSPGQPLLRRHHAIVITWILWIFSLIITTPYVWMLQITTLESHKICGEFCTEIWPDEKSKRIYTIFVLLVQSFIPFSIMAICYNAVFKFLNKRAHSRLTSIGQQSNMLYFLTATAGGITHYYSEQLFHLSEQRKKVLVQKKRITVILTSMVLIFGLTTLPHNIVSLITEFDSSNENEPNLMTLPNGTDLTYLVNLLSHCIAMLSCVANPILYGFLNPEFREVILGTLKRSPLNRQSFRPTQTSTMPTQRPKSVFVQTNVKTNVTHDSSNTIIV